MSDDDSNDSGSKPPKIGGKISKGTVLHFPANTGEVTRRRLLLRSAGFPPIPIEGKAPKINGWQNMGEASERMIAGWEGQYPRQLSTGILSATVPGFDIDIMGEAGAQAAEEFVLNWFKDRGKILIRVGQPPKRLIPFRTVNGFRK
jgi:hypothetical protein